MTDQSLADVAVGPGRTSPIVILCSGLGAERIDDRELFAWLRRADRAGATIGAVCTGAHLLARAGLLNGHKCTIHWENLPGFVEEFPDIEVTADLFEVDRHRLTCSGGTAALDLMLHLIAARHGQELVTKISEQCIMDRVRQAHDHQRMPYRVRLGIHHPKLIGAIEMMEANVEEPLDQAMLARYVGLSRRQLERLFRKHLGRSPAQYYLELRLERARHLLYQTTMPIMNVAFATRLRLGLALLDLLPAAVRPDPARGAGRDRLADCRRWRCDGSGSACITPITNPPISTRLQGSTRSSWILPTLSVIDGAAPNRMIRRVRTWAA